MQTNDEIFLRKCNRYISFIVFFQDLEITSFGHRHIVLSGDYKTKAEFYQITTDFHYFSWGLGWFKDCSLLLVPFNLV